MNFEKKADNFIIVNYHYVRDVVRDAAEKSPFFKIHAMGADQFERQLEKLKKEYELISINDVYDAIENKSTLPKKSCALSFDDGLKDHYKIVFPILKKNNVSGVFFPITETFSGRVSVAHKIHFLLAKLGADEMVSEFYNFFKKKPTSFRDKYSINDKERMDPRYTYDTVLTANLKFTLQVMPIDLSSEFLDKIFEKYFGNEKKFAKELYLSEDELRKMSNNGMVIGSHTHTHPRMDQLSFDEQEKELRLSKEILYNILQKPVTIISYPYGKYNMDTIAIAKKLGYAIGLTVSGSINGNLNRWELGRVDAGVI